jgi:ABC-type antimicrobial peptide transport system permease subunit
VLLLLLLTGLAACVGPALRAARLDPVAAIRQE